MEFEWDAGNIDHFAQHRVAPQEAEEAITDPRRVPRRAYTRNSELRQAIIGVTRSGRVLVVIYTIREGRIRPVTGFTATGQNLRRYLAEGRP